MIRAKLTGSRKLQAQLERLSFDPADQKKLLRKMGGLVAQASKDRIRHQIDLNDQAFKPRKSGGVTSFRDAEMKEVARTIKPMLWGWIKKIGYRVQGAAVVVMVKGRSSATAALHQYGAIIPNERGFSHSSLSEKQENQGRTLMFRKATNVMADALIDAAKRLETHEVEARKKKIAAAVGKEAKDKARKKVAGPGMWFLLNWPRKKILATMTRTKAERYLWKLTGQERAKSALKGFRVLPARSFLGASAKDRENLRKLVVDFIRGRRL